MGTKKIIILVGFVCMLLSCNNMTSNPSLVELKEENSTLNKNLDRIKEEKEQAIKRDIDQGNIIDNALQELSEISQSSNQIRINLGETNTLNDITQTERLSEQIQSIKNRLDSLKSGYPNLYQRIERLQKLVEAKDEEISQLKNDIEKKNQEIASKTDIIENQDVTINKLNNDAERAKKDIAQLYNNNKKQMAELWYQMGEKLISISNNLPQVRGAKDKKMIQDTRLLIHKNAKNCYLEAYNFGHQQAYSKYNRY